MKNVIKILLLLCVSLAPVAGHCGESAGKPQEIKTVKKERIHIRKGNKLYASKRFADAEVEYRKALQENPQSQIATFNLATSLLKQSNGSGQSKDKNDPLNQAETLLGNVVKTTANAELQWKAYYDLGNIAYRRQQYDKAIECYKNALRKNPNDDEARDNLRLAQLKKKDGGQNNQNKNQNKDKDNKDITANYTSADSTLDGKEVEHRTNSEDHAGQGGIDPAKGQRLESAARAERAAQNTERMVMCDDLCVLYYEKI